MSGYPRARNGAEKSQQFQGEERQRSGNEGVWNIMPTWRKETIDGEHDRAPLF